MAAIKLHPVRKQLRARRKSQIWLVGRLNRAGIQISAALISGILNRKNRVKWEIATAIARIVENVTPNAIMEAAPPPKPRRPRTNAVGNFSAPVAVEEPEKGAAA